MTVLVGLLGPGFCEAQRPRPRPTRRHYYDSYLINRRAVDKVLDGMSSSSLSMNALTNVQVWMNDTIYLCMIVYNKFVCNYSKLFTVHDLIDRQI